MSFCASFPIGFAHVQTPTFARGSVFANEPSARQVQEQDKYKVYLKEQVNVPGLSLGRALRNRPGSSSCWPLPHWSPDGPWRASELSPSCISVWGLFGLLLLQQQNIPYHLPSGRNIFCRCASLKTKGLSVSMFSFCIGSVGVDSCPTSKH